MENVEPEIDNNVISEMAKEVFDTFEEERKRTKDLNANLLKKRIKLIEESKVTVEEKLHNRRIERYKTIEEQIENQTGGSK